MATLAAFFCQNFRDDTLDQRHGDTCKWFFESDEYKAWIREESNSSSNLLWISGDPGSGKSVLMSYVTKELTSVHCYPVPPIVAYFFCDDKRNEQRPATAILRSLIHQILSQAQSLYQYIPHEYLPESNKTWGFVSLWRVFTCLVAAVNSDVARRTLFCVVDALDECEPKSQDHFLENLVTWLGRQSHSDNKFRMIITSRPELLQTRELPSFAHISLEKKNSQDIWSYVDHRVQLIGRLKHLPKDLMVDIRQAVVDGALGMFLWVSLTLYNLERSVSTSPRSIRAQLKELPKDIPTIYAGILEEIDSEWRERAKRILQWITCTKRPLLVKELKVVIALQPEHTSIAAIQEDIESSLGYFFSSLFGPLLKIERDTTVRFVHQSVKDLLTNAETMTRFDALSQSPLPSPVSVFHIVYAESNLSIAVDCLHYLSSDEFENKPSIDALESYSQLTTDAFFDYAATQWPGHVRGAEDHKGDKALVDAFLELASSKAKMYSAYQIYYEDGDKGEYGLRPPRRPPLRETPPLQICVSLGLDELVQGLLAHGVDASEQGGVYGSALYAAVYNRSEAMVKAILISMGEQGFIDEGAFREVAGWCEDPDTLDLILRRGAHISEGVMLSAASNPNSPEALRFLLERGGTVTEEVHFLTVCLECGGLSTWVSFLTSSGVCPKSHVLFSFIMHD